MKCAVGTLRCASDDLNTGQCPGERDYLRRKSRSEAAVRLRIRPAGLVAHCCAPRLAVPPGIDIYRWMVGIESGWGCNRSECCWIRMLLDFDVVVVL